jgi:hypothetical protein
MNPETQDEKVIGIVAKLYELREEAMVFYGDQYPARVDIFKRAIRRRAEETGEERLKTVLAIMQELRNVPFAMLMFAAAYVELVEAKP